MKAKTSKQDTRAAERSLQMHRIFFLPKARECAGWIDVAVTCSTTLTAAFLDGKVQLHMGGVLLKLFEHVGGRCPEDVVYLVDLVKLVGTRKQRIQRHNLEKHAPDAPQVHLVIVVTVSEETFWCSVPAGRYVLCVRLLGIDPSAGPEVCKLKNVVGNENILGLDIAMKDAVSVHMVHGLD